MQTVSFIGTGHMGSSIASVLAAKTSLNLLLHNRTTSKALDLALQFGPNTQVASLEEALCADLIFLGVKPKDFSDLIASFPFAPKGIVVSMLAGVSLDELSSALPNCRIIRIMPNTPVALGKGFVPYCVRNVSKEDLDEILPILSAMGTVQEIEENKMDAYSVISGSSPAFIDYFLNALIEAGQSIGLSKDESIKAVLATTEGSVALAKASSYSLKTLCEQVCSPGGSTIEGVRVLINCKIEDAINGAVHASFKKNKHMK